jgi:hypothetical protein
MSGAVSIVNRGKKVCRLCSTCGCAFLIATSVDVKDRLATNVLKWLMGAIARRPEASTVATLPGGVSAPVDSSRTNSGMLDPGGSQLLSGKVTESGCAKAIPDGSSRTAASV